MTVTDSKFTFCLRVTGAPSSRDVRVCGSIQELGLWSESDSKAASHVVEDAEAVFTIFLRQLEGFLKFRYVCDDPDQGFVRDIPRIVRLPEDFLRDMRSESTMRVLVQVESVWGDPRSRVSIFQPESPLEAPALSVSTTAGLRFVLLKLQELREEKDKLRSDLLAISSSVAHVPPVKRQVAQLEYNRVIRDLLFEINELKGKVKVVARFRPLIEGERAVLDFSLPDHSHVSVYSQDGFGERQFRVDEVFDESVNNESFYEMSKIRSVVESSVLISNNVCIFSYGQTNSGKSHTVLGSRGEKGIADLTLESVFSTMTTHGCRKRVFVEMTEIYRENVFPLVHKTEVLDLVQVMELFHTSIEGRATASTNLNSTSSRSHFIFTLTLTDEASQSNIFLVDLAGSERTKISGAEGDRLAEANAINKSLSTLALVLNGLLNKRAFIPYRDSKLTKMLAPVFTVTEPPSKVVMIANLSPNLNDERETISTLQFAQRVSSIELRDSASQVAVDAELERKTQQLNHVILQQRRQLDALKQAFHRT